MANYQRNVPRSRARRQAEQRRLRLIVFGGTAAVVLVALLVVALLPRGGAPDRAVSQPVEGVPQAEGEPLVAQAAAEGDGIAAAEPAAATPTPEPAPTPTPQGDTVSFASLRSATRPTPTAPGYGLVFSEADTEEKIIAITVDDCFQAENLQRMVDKAIEVGGRFTIFPIGQNVLKQAQSEVLKYAWEQGFELENHTFTHNGLYRCSDEEMAREVYMQQMALSHILGVEYQCHFLRPKGGDARRDQRMQVYAEQLGYYGIAHWSCAGSTSTEREIAKALKPGAIYLFHTTTTNDLDKLLNFMPYAVEKGYRLVTLNEMFGYPENETKPLTGPAKDYPVPPLQPYSRVYDVYKPTRYSWGVYLLQQKLIELGYMKGEPDGVYGQDCAKCVKAYQKDHGLEQTGVADVALQEQIFGVPSGA
ncbi:MAG: polysaccharide deacetylase family protein [Clostridia bacterium]|nr:polysaccharide deacetylase family protein [Clostridia bacterium]